MRVFALLGLALGALSAQVFDTSGTAKLQGDYFIRQVLLSGVSNTGSIGRARSLIGVMTFDGNGNYSFTGEFMDTQNGSPQTYAATGKYSVSSSNVFQLQNPMDTNQYVFGGLGQGVLTGSSTESGYNDLFVGIPAGSTASAGSLSGPYRIGFIDFPSGDPTQVRDGWFTLTADGQGNAGAVTLNGAAANLGSTSLAQTINGLTYSLSGEGSGALNIPLQGATAQSQLTSGNKTFYLSGDHRFVLGGAPDGFDLMFGFQAPASGLSDAAFKNTYFLGALEDDASGLGSGGSRFDSAYGSQVSTGTGIAITHLRFARPGSDTIDYTFNTAYSMAPDATVSKDFFQYVFGLNGEAFFIVGRGSQYSFSPAVQAPAFSGGSVFLNPLGVVNLASYAPVTNSVAPFEYVTLYGNNLAPSASFASGVPFPTTLNGVQVTVNGRPAPLLYVSPGSIKLVVPGATSEPYATFRVSNNGTASNPVTTFTNATAPGVFSLTQNGVGSAAALHADYTVVDGSHPAHSGETVQIYLTGLGAVSPAVPDGSAASASTLSTVNSDVAVYINGTKSNVVFKGLAPGFVSLYQLNVQIPQGLPSGTVTLEVTTPHADTSMTSLSVAP